MSHYDVWSNNGQQSWSQYQYSIENQCPALWHANDKPGGHDNHEDRWDTGRGGYIYSWDQNANGEKGAWGVSGKLKDGKSPTDPDFSANDIIWFDSKTYGEESDSARMN